jgi:putative membrane protein
MRENKSVRNTLIIAAALIVITVSFLTIYNIRSRNESPVSTKDLIEIKEKMFISQVNDVYLNKDDYLGKTIKLEGLFKMEQAYDKLHCFVLRFGPGCCGYDGAVGFEVAWDKGKKNPYPGEDAWVEATGELKTYNEADYVDCLYLDLVSLNVLDKRGNETVVQ